MTDMAARRLQEMIEVLAGARGGSTRRAAVRLEDLQALTRLPNTLSSRPTSASAPSAEDFNALVADLQVIHRALLLIAKAVGTRGSR